MSIHEASAEAEKNTTIIDRPRAEVTPPLWVRPKEAMRLIGVRTTKFFSLLNDGTIKSRRVGNMRLVQYASLMNIGQADQDETV